MISIIIRMITHLNARIPQLAWSVSVSVDWMYHKGFVIPNDFNFLQLTSWETMRLLNITEREHVGTFGWDGLTRNDDGPALLATTQMLGTPYTYCWDGVLIVLLYIYIYIYIYFIIIFKTIIYIFFKNNFL